MTVIIRDIAPITTNSGLILTPYDSSWKNLIKPALEAGILGVVSFFFLLIVGSTSVSSRSVKKVFL